MPSASQQEYKQKWPRLKEAAQWAGDLKLVVRVVVVYANRDTDEFGQVLRFLFVLLDQECEHCQACYHHRHNHNWQHT